jgi:hypothetical protein
MPAPNISDSRALRVTWIAWGVMLLLGCAAVVGHPDYRQANDSYADGARRWLAGEDLYADGGAGFIYLPQSALLYAPLTLLPKPVEHIVWRIITIGLFAAGIRRLCSVARNGHGTEFFPLVSLLVLPKVWAGVIHGQAAAAMAGLSMLAVGEIYRQRWGRAATLLVAALAFKPLAIVLILLAVALYRPLSVRLALGMGGLFLVPYLTHHPGYVTAQYLASIDMFGKAAEMGQTNEWPHLFSLASLAGVEMNGTWRTALRVAAALGTLGLCRRLSQRRISHTSRPHRNVVQKREFQIENCKLKIENSSAETPRAASHGHSQELNSGFTIPHSAAAASSVLTIYALATVYLLLFNPRTENNSYLVLAPVMALLSARAYSVEGRTIRAALLLAGTIALFAGHEICQFLTPQFGFVWISPLVCLVLAIDLVRTAMSAAREMPPEQSSATAALPRPHGLSRNSEQVAAAGAESRR